MPLKQAFLLHQYPTLHLDEAGNPFYSRIPEQELALLEDVSWPIVNGHLDDLWQEAGREDFVGTAFKTKIRGGFLHAGEVSIGLNEKKWQGGELSTVYAARREKLEQPYTWVDNEGKIGAAGKSYEISEHQLDVRPVNAALVKGGRYGNNVAMRDRNDRLLIANAAVELKDKDMAELKPKPTLPGEEGTVTNAGETTSPEATPETDQSTLIQSIIGEIFKEGGVAATFFAEQSAQVQAVVANAKTEIEQLVANAKAAVPETSKEEVEEKPLTAELIANSVAAAFKECLGKADLATPHTPVANSGEKPMSFADMIAANNKA